MRGCGVRIDLGCLRGKGWDDKGRGRLTSPLSFTFSSSYAGRQSKIEGVGCGKRTLYGAYHFASRVLPLWMCQRSEGFVMGRLVRPTVGSG